MTSDETRAFVKRYCDLWERGNVRGLVDCYAEHAHIDSPMFHAIDGREAIEKSFVDLFQVFTDSKIHIDDIIVDCESAEHCVTVWTSHGTHRGMLFGMPGSGRRIDVAGAFVMRFENGRIVRERRLYDFVGMLVQLGVLKAKAV
jgi:steroid delta-isomerase-like uncharacterized protein